MPLKRFHCLFHEMFHFTDSSAISNDQDIQNVINQVYSLHLVIDTQQFEAELKGIRMLLGNSPICSRLFARKRFAEEPHVVLVDRASRHGASNVWKRYRDCYFACLKAQQPAVHDATVDVGVGGCEVNLVIWDDKTMMWKVEMRSRWDDVRDDIEFEGEQPLWADQHPFIAVGTLDDHVDLEEAGKDLLSRWLNQPSSSSTEEPDSKSIFGLEETTPGKVFSMLLTFPPLPFGVVRPMPQQSRSPSGDPTTASQDSASGGDVDTRSSISSDTSIARRTSLLDWLLQCCGRRTVSRDTEG